jgi:hypothetical protein
MAEDDWDEIIDAADGDNIDDKTLAMVQRMWSLLAADWLNDCGEYNLRAADILDMLVTNGLRLAYCNDRRRAVGLQAYLMEIGAYRG